MASERVFVLLLVLATASTALGYMGGRRYSSQVTSCAAMQCPEGTTCEEGRVICFFSLICFTLSTTCKLSDPIADLGEDGSSGFSDEFSGSDEECSGLGEEGSESGEEGSGICAMNMYSTTCGPLCPQDCSNEITCQAISCTDEERCFCNPGHVLLNKDDPSLGCVLPEECLIVV